MFPKFLGESPLTALPFQTLVRYNIMVWYLHILRNLTGGGTIFVNRQIRRTSRRIHTSVYNIDMVSVLPGISREPPQQIKPLVFY